MTHKINNRAVVERRSEPPDSLDDFPTPPWATRALCALVLCEERLSAATVWEPACNRGHMALPLAQYFDRVLTSDVHHYGWSGQQRVCDLLFHGSEPDEEVDWVITNPPFRLAAQFVERGLQVARVGVAVLVRTAFLEGIARYRELFLPRPPSVVAQFTERVVIRKGRLYENGSTATAYCWLVWKREPASHATQLVWIPPCKATFVRPGDYEVPA